MSLSRTYNIDSVLIQLTYPNGVTENLRLKKPRGFEFRFRKEARLPTYRDAEQVWQRGNYFYQLLVKYDYEWHEMDLRKLLVAEKIRLRFPPAFGQPHNYNTAEVLLANDEVIKNYFGGLAVGSETGEVVPSGSITLEFEGVDAFTEFQAMNLIGWKQGDVGDDDGDDDGGDDPDLNLSNDTIYMYQRTSANPYEISIYRAKFSNDGWSLDPDDLIEVDLRTVYPELTTGSHDEAGIFVLPNGNICFITTRTSGTPRPHHFCFFDKDLNFIRADTELCDNISFPTSTSRRYKASCDAEGNFYILIYEKLVQENNSAGQQSRSMRIRKYDQHFNIIWETENQWAVGTARGLIITENRAIMARTQNTTSGSPTPNFTGYSSFDLKTGELVDNLVTPIGTSQWAWGLIDSKTFMVSLGSSSGDPGTHELRIYDESLNLIDSYFLDEYTDIVHLGVPVISADLNGNTFFGQGGRLSYFNALGKTQLWTIDTVVTSTQIHSINHTADGRIVAGVGSGTSGQVGIIIYDPAVPERIIYDHINTPGSTTRSKKMLWDNWQLRFLAGTPDSPRPQLYSLSVHPKTGQSPHTITIEFTVVNRSTSVYQGNLLLNGNSFFQFEVPASGNIYETLEHTFEEGGVFVFTLGDQIQTVYVDEAPPPVQGGNFAGSIEILSTADSDFAGKAPQGNIDVVGLPNRQSDPCESDGDKFNVIYEGTPYCTILPDTSKQIISNSVSGFISSQIPNLGSTSGGISPQGDPRIRVFSENIGTDDNGKFVTFSVNVNLEGPVFSKLQVLLSGGEDPRAIDDPVDILIGGTLFATTEPIQGDESAISVATKIFDACVAVDTQDLSFERDGATVHIFSTLNQELSVALNIRGAGFDFETSNIIEI